MRSIRAVGNRNDRVSVLTGLIRRRITHVSVSRKRIPLVEKLAAALACLLPEQERGALRTVSMISAAEVLKRFEWHHIVPYAWGGADKWWNLHPMPKQEHKEQTKRDLKAMAKSNRIRRKHLMAPAAARKSGASLIHKARRLGLYNLAAIGQRRQRRKWPSRKIPSRGFQRAKQ